MSAEPNPVQSISVKEIPRLVEQQKNIALHTPLYVFCTDAAKSSFQPISNQFCDIYQNPELFSINNQASIEDVLASAIPRTMIFFLYKQGRSYWKKWLDSSVTNALRSMPYADLYSVEVKFGDNDEVIKLGAKRLPCVLSYKMGHLIDITFPEHEEGLVRDEIIQHNIEVDRMNKEAEVVIDYTQDDADRIEFENRYRQKEAEEKKRINEDNKKHLLEVKKKIEQDKLERQRKYGKK